MSGAASTVAGSWFSSKIRLYYDSRKAHLEDIKSKVLLPIRKELEDYEPFVLNTQPLFSVVHATTKYHGAAPLTQSPVEGERVLIASYPVRWLYRDAEPALTLDIEKSHFPEVVAALKRFLLTWDIYTSECKLWVGQMAQSVLEQSGLPKFPNMTASGGWPKPHVMHLDVALFIFLRAFGLTTASIRLQHNAGRASESCWSIQSDLMGYASGSDETLKILLNNIDALRVSQSHTANKLLTMHPALQAEFASVQMAVDHAIASQRLRNQCNLVPFL